MRWPFAAFFVFLFLAPQSAIAGSGELMRHVRAIVAPETQGRLAGTKGANRAADYIESQMKAIGLEPAGDDGFEIETELVNAVEFDTSLTIGTHVAAPDVEFGVSGFSDDVDVEGVPVFVGYGLSDSAWDDYQGADVRGRIVIAMTGCPEGQEERLSSKHLLSSQSKAAVALSKGAKAMILVNDPRAHGDSDTQRADELPRTVPAFPLEGIGVVRLTAKAFATGFAADLAKLQTEVDGGKWQHLAVKTKVALEIDVDRDDVDTASIAGMVRGSSDKPPIVFGAHFDGLGEAAIPGYQGADDNASGVAVMLAVARRVANQKGRLKRTVIFVALTGEELGYVGARRAARFIDETYGRGVFINLDMAGRLDDDGLRAFGLESWTANKAATSAASGSGMALDAHPLYASGSDHIAFAEAGFGSIGFSTGIHPGYHSADDRIEKLNWKQMAKIEVFLGRLIRDLAD